MTRNEECKPVDLDRAQQDIQQGLEKAHRLVVEAEPVLRVEQQILEDINRVVTDPPQP